MARYVIKKKLGYGSDKDYQMIDIETGEVVTKTKEFTHMSLKPGIGKGFYDKWKTDMFPLDVCIVQGKESKPPQYYFKKLALEDPEVHEEILYRREQQALVHAADNIQERKEIKEKVLEARVKLLKREFFKMED